MYKGLYITATCLLWLACTSKAPTEPIPSVNEELDRVLEKTIEARVIAAYWEGYVAGAKAQSDRDKHEVLAAIRSKKGIERYLEDIGKKRFVLVGDYPDLEAIIKAKENKIARSNYVNQDKVLCGNPTKICGEAW